MRKLEFIVVVGTRPNFMKIMPLCKEFAAQKIQYKIFSSGQHYDYEMAGIFEKQFKLEKIYHYQRTKDNSVENIQETIFAFKKYLFQNRSVSGVIVVGDVNTSYACALATKAYKMPLIHIEAGLRSFDLTMPEESNRITIDHLSDMLFVSCKDAITNLTNEQIIKNIYFVGNIMIDTLRITIEDLEEKKKFDKNYIIVTIHRPENVDDEERLSIITNQINLLSKKYKNIILPLHPRTKKQIDRFKLWDRLSNCICSEPLGYEELLSLLLRAKAVITDSGGLQEETTYLHVPCFTVRKSTERPITITEGTNRLIEPYEIVNAIDNISQHKYPSTIPELWDGHTAERIVNILKEFNF